MKEFLLDGFSRHFFDDFRTKNESDRNYFISSFCKDVSKAETCNFVLPFQSTYRPHGHHNHLSSFFAQTYMNEVLFCFSNFFDSLSL